MRMLGNRFLPQVGGGAAVPIWWNNNGAISGCIAAYQPKGAISLAASYVNLANPGTFDATPGVAPILVAGGWDFASNKYLANGIALSANHTVICRFTNAATNGVVFGARSADDVTEFFIIPALGITSRFYAFGTSPNNRATPSGVVASGVMALAGNKGYLGSTLNATMTATLSGSTPAMLIGALQSGASVSNYFGGVVCALAVYNAVLSGADIATVTTAMQAL